MEFEVLAEGLQFPEGPIIMDDGSVIVVEIRRGTLSRVWNGKIEVIAELGGGPNGAAIGPDGAVYVCNNGGFTWENRDGFMVINGAAKDYVTGLIQRVDLKTGKFERIYDNVKGNRLSGPNDIVFDKQGNFYFTDLGKNYARTKDFGGLYYAKPDGSMISELSYGSIGFNGVGLSPDEKTVYAAETHTARLFAFEITEPGKVKSPAGRCINAQGKLCFFDSMAVQADGGVCVATIRPGGVTTVMPDGSSSFVEFPDPVTTNICFGGADMRDAYITLSITGKLIKARWPTPGHKLNFNA